MMYYIVMRKEIEQFVNSVHKDHTYGEGRPYTYHLNMVKNILADAGMSDDDDVEIAMCHDTIEDIHPDDREDAKQFLKENTSNHVYKTVWALTGIGEYREARNRDAYSKIAAYPSAANYKVADRIANMETSKVERPKLYKRYLEELSGFIDNVVVFASNEYLVARLMRHQAN